MDNYFALLDCLKKHRIPFEQNVELKYYTSFQIGGPAKVMALPDSIGQIQAVIDCCRNAEIPYFILGKGSNLLVADEGYDGVAIYVCGDGLQQIELSGEDKIICQAGASLASVCKFALEYGLSGLEFAFGIPGSIGGAAYMNAGAYGGEMKDITFRCDHITNLGQPGSFKNSQLDFSYRHSTYSCLNYCITQVHMQLKRADKNQIQSRMKELIGRRKDKQPLEYPSAGSVFKRPDGAYAAALIEQCGLKGVSVGGAQVSEKHSGFIINKGGATCKDVLMLIEHVQSVVLKQTGYRLECEIKRIGT